MADKKEKPVESFECQFMSESTCCEMDTMEFYKERVTYLEKLVKRYKYDMLTGLMGKRDFSAKFDRLFEECKFANEKFYFVLIDIDNLHNLNREKGYHEGDKVIKSVADNLIEQFEFHQCYRISGDEFAVLVRAYHCDEAEMNEKLKTVKNSTWVLGKSCDGEFINPKHLFKYTDTQLTKKKGDRRRI